MTSPKLSKPYRLSHPDQYTYDRSTLSAFGLSNILLAVYVFSIIIISKSPQYMNLSQGIGIALAYSFAMEYLAIRQTQLRWPQELIPLALFCFLMLLGSLWATHTNTAITRTLTYLQLLIFAVVAMNILYVRRSIKSVSIGLLAGTIVTAFDVWRSNGFSLGAQDRWNREAGFLFNPNIYAITLVIAGMVCLYLYHYFSHPVIRIGLISAILLFVQQIIFFSGSRKGVIGIIVAVVSFLLLSQLRRSKFLLSRLFFTIIVSLIALTLGSQLIERSVFVDRYTQGISEDSANTRIKMVEAGINLWKERPIWGYGTSQFSFEFADTGDSYSHNNYIELLVNNGIVGLIVYYSFFVVLVRRLVGKYTARKLSHFQLAWTLTVIIILLTWDFTLVSYYEKIIWIAYILLIAIADIDLWDTAEV